MSYIKKAAGLATLLSMMLLSCGTEQSNQKIIGKWQGVSWEVQGQPSGRNAAEVVFEFHADDTYSAAFGPQKEAGAFRLVDDKLYTTARGQVEKMVAIRLVATDTLVMDMNRVGTAEQLVLVKNE